MSLYLNTELTTPGRIVPPRWDDIRVPVTSTRLGGNDPSFTVYKTNGSGSRGVFAYRFNATNEKELFFSLQLPHGYKLGSDIHPHVHWIPAAAGSAGQVVNWGLEYTWKDIGSVYGNTGIIHSNTHIPADNILAADKHYLTPFDAISGADAGAGLSSMLVCRVFRDAGGALGTDDYASDAILLEIDFHVELDTDGSRLIYAK